MIENIEQKSEYIFNYDPELLKEYYYSGSIDIIEFKGELTGVLYDSPFTYEIDNNTVLVYQSKQSNYTICGTILDAQTYEPLIAANVVAPNILIGTQSDANGNFDFEVSAYKNQKIEISYIGYKMLSFMVQDLESSDCPKFELEVDQDLMGREVLITDYILDGILEGDEFGSFALDFDQLSKNHSTVEHDILKTAQLLPGINSMDDSATNLQIRGSSADQNLILWEGAPIYNAGHIFGMISAINPFSVDQVRIYKGAYDPKYDNRVGGIIDISLSDTIDNIFQGSIGSTLTEVHTNLDIPIIDDHLSMVLSGRKSIKGIYESPPLQSYTKKVFQFSIIDDRSQNSPAGDIDSEQVLDYNDWNTKLLYKVNDQIRVNLGLYQNKQDFDYTFSPAEDTYVETDKIAVSTQAIKTGIDIDFHKKWTSSISFYRSSYNNEYNRLETEDGEFLNGYKQTNNINDKSYTVSNIFTPTKALNIKTGYEYNTKEVQLDLGDDSRFEPIFESQSRELADFQNLFLSLTYSTVKFKLDVGTRSTRYEQFGQWVQSPRLNLQYYINDHWKLKVDGGIYHQFVSQLNDFGTNQITEDNPLWILNTSSEQLYQKANKIATGFVFSQNGWLLDVDAYYNYTTGLSTVSPVLGLLSGDRPFSRGNSSTKGIDLLIKKRWSKFNTWINYSLGRNENDFLDFSEDRFYSPNDIRHNISLVASYKIKNIQFSLNAKYHSGLPYSLPSVVPNEEEPDANPPFNFFLDYSDYNENRLRPYMRLDFNINYRPSLPYLGNLKSEISFTMINLLNYENVVSREYDIDFDIDAPNPTLTYIKKTLLRRTPLLLVRFYW